MEDAAHGVIPVVDPHVDKHHIATWYVVVYMSLNGMGNG